MEKQGVGGSGGSSRIAISGVHAGSLADDVATNDDLGLLVAPLVTPDDGWTVENPKPKIPGPPKTNVTRYRAATEKAFILALCCFYDESTLYALRWDKAGMSHPVDGQRNGKRPGPSTGGKIDMDTVATYWALAVLAHLQNADWGLPTVWISDRNPKFIKGFWRSRSEESSRTHRPHDYHYTERSLVAPGVERLVHLHRW